MSITSRTLVGLSVLLLAAATAAAQEMPTSQTETTKGTAAVTTQQLKGEVMYVEGNDLVVKTTAGEIKTFRVPESRVFVVDGKNLTVHELKPGTRLSAKVTTTTTPVMDRTTTVGSGTVWYVMGKNVILTLPNGENRQYMVKDDVKFILNGQPATVYDLRKGMVVSAEKIVEEQRIEVAVDTQVVGQSPAAAGAPAPAGAAASETPTQVASLPKTGSAVHLVGLLGLLSLGASLGLRRFNR